MKQDLVPGLVVDLGLLEVLDELLEAGEALVPDHPLLRTVHVLHLWMSSYFS